MGSLVLLLVVIDGYYRLLETLRPETECIFVYLEQVQWFFAANAVKPDRQIPGMLSAIRGWVYDLISDLLSPEKPEDKPFDELKTLFIVVKFIAEQYTTRHSGRNILQLTD